MVSTCGALLRDYVLHGLAASAAALPINEAEQRRRIAENARLIRVLFTLGEMLCRRGVRIGRGGSAEDEQGAGGAAGGSPFLGGSDAMADSEAIVSAVQMLLAPELAEDGVKGRMTRGSSCHRDDGCCCTDPARPCALVVRSVLPVESAEPPAGRIEIPTPIRAHAFVTLGKLCLRDRNLAKEFIPLFARELQDTSTPNSIRNNILIVLGDLCTASPPNSASTCPTWRRACTTRSP